MKDLIDTTIHNLMVIKHEVCYHEGGVTKCHKCHFCSIGTYDGYDCSLDYILRDLSFYKSSINTKETAK